VYVRIYVCNQVGMDVCIGACMYVCMNFDFAESHYFSFTTDRCRKAEV